MIVQKSHSAVSHNCAEVGIGVCCQFQTVISPLQTAARQKEIALTAASVLVCEWDKSFKLNDTTTWIKDTGCVYILLLLTIT